jgi:hypothetical protein
MVALNDVAKQYSDPCQPDPIGKSVLNHLIRVGSDPPPLAAWLAAGCGVSRSQGAARTSSFPGTAVELSASILLNPGF